jgi:hypothetical protein
LAFSTTKSMLKTAEPAIYSIYKGAIDKNRTPDSESTFCNKLLLAVTRSF